MKISYTMVKPMNVRSRLLTLRPPPTYMYVMDNSHPYAADVYTRFPVFLLFRRTISSLFIVTKCRLSLAVFTVSGCGQW